MSAAAAERAPGVTSLDAALATIAATAAQRDGAPNPTFPDAAIGLLRDAGALCFNAFPGPERPPAARELGLVRGVARADASVGRIFDGHLNGVERLAVQAPVALRDRELAGVRDGTLLVGVWGGDPHPGEGSPATIERDGTLTGVKTFCSGAGGLQRALVLAHDPGATGPIAVWIDLTDPGSVSIDQTWYRSSGLRASVSHRVVFARAPVLARLGGPGGLSEFPWFSRDALRTAATWAGMADRAFGAAIGELARRPAPGPLDELAVGRMITARDSIGAWLERAARAMDAAAPELSSIALHCRAAVATACRTLLDEAARACGSHPFATGGDLDRTRRDLELFLLQHRLDPALAAAGARLLEDRRRRS